MLLRDNVEEMDLMHLNVDLQIFILGTNITLSILVSAFFPLFEAGPFDSKDPRILSRTEIGSEIGGICEFYMKFCRTTLREDRQNALLLLRS